MIQKASLHPSGFSFIDEKFGGLAGGSFYLLLGNENSGKSSFALQILDNWLSKAETCLYFTNTYPQDIIDHADYLGIDLSGYVDRNQLIFVFVDKPKLPLNKKQDEYLIEYFRDLLTIVNQYKTDRLIFDELTDYLNFEDTEKSSRVLEDYFTLLEKNKLTSLFLIDPMSEFHNVELNKFLRLRSKGIFHLYGSEHLTDNGVFGGKIEFDIPGTANFRELNAYYTVEKEKGFKIFGENEFLYDSSSGQKTTSIDKPLHMIVSNKFLSSTRIYSYDDLKLLVNNRIARFRLTGTKFALLSFEFEPDIELVNRRKLRDVICLTTNPEIKVSVYKDRIYALIPDNQVGNISNILRNIAQELLRKSPVSRDWFLESVVVSRIIVNRGMNDADDLILKLNYSEQSALHSTII